MCARYPAQPASMFAVALRSNAISVDFQKGVVVVPRLTETQYRNLLALQRLELWAATNPIETARRNAARQTAECASFRRSGSKRATINALVRATTRLEGARISPAHVYEITGGYGRTHLTEFQRRLATAYFDSLSWEHRVLLEQWVLSALRVYEAGVSEPLVTRILRRLAACLLLSHASGRPLFKEYVSRVLREIRSVIVPTGPPVIATVGP
jgi:hypothetical protein